MGRSTALLALGTIVLLLAPTVAAAPDNDNRANPRTVGAMVPGVGVVPGLPPNGPLKFVDNLNTAGATIEAGEALPCGLIGSTAWYTWTVTTLGRLVNIDTIGSNYDTVVAVYRVGAGGVLTLIACNDDFFGLQSFVQFTPMAPNTYLIQLGGFASQQGMARLNLESLSF